MTTRRLRERVGIGTDSNSSVVTLHDKSWNWNRFQFQDWLWSMRAALVPTQRRSACMASNTRMTIYEWCPDVSRSWHARTEAYFMQPLTSGLLAMMRAVLEAPRPSYRFLREIDYVMAEADTRVRLELRICVEYAEAVLMEGAVRGVAGLALAH